MIGRYSFLKAESEPIFSFAHIACVDVSSSEGSAVELRATNVLECPRAAVSACADVCGHSE